MLTINDYLDLTQAHNSYEDCLNGNAALVNISQLVGDGWVLTTEGDNVTMAVCDLAEQLDKSASGTGLAFILFTGMLSLQII